MSHFSLLDYGVFIVYLLASVFIGVLFVKEQRTTEDYLLAGRNMGYVAVAISILASLFSGISYLGAPAEVYKNGLSFALIAFSFFIATPITTLLFVPFFYQARFYTAYQYLEERFSVGIRTLAAVLFITRVLLWLGLATYAPALALEKATGFPLWMTIVATGVVTTFYTALGGMKAVIWTDVMQFVVLLGGQFIILLVALNHVPGGVAGVYQIGVESHKFDLSWSLDPNVRVTFWAIIIGGAFTNLVQMATDQVSVQRYLSVGSLKEAQKSLWTKLWLTLPTLFLFYIGGLVLFAFYKGNDPVAAGRVASADQILPYFVVNELPSGLPGLLISAIFAASMSTISSGINALTTTSIVDFAQRLLNWKNDDERTLKLARNLTVFYGALVILLAFVVQRLGSLLEASNKAIGLAGGPLLGLFLLGMLTKRANARGAFIGWAAGFLSLIPVAFFSDISFLWYAMIGAVMTFVVGLIASLIVPDQTPKAPVIRDQDALVSP